VKLLTTLAAGIRGAEGGYAIIYRHRTTQYATLYSDPYGKDPVETSPVTLDDYGGAIRYVNEIVDIAVYSYSGDLVRQWTEMGAAPAIEVVSSHFPGADPVTGQTGVSKHVDLLTVLELLDSSITNITNGNAWAFYYVVTYEPYGAEGDGVADDTVAVQAAIDACHAAGGGTVYFPGGIYRTTSTLTQYSDTRILGAGPSASIILADLTEDPTVIEQAAVTGGYFVIEHLGIGVSDPDGPHAYNGIVSSGGAEATGCQFICRDVWFSASAFELSTCVDYSAAGLKAGVTFLACQFSMDDTYGIYATSTSPNDVYVAHITAIGCLFENRGDSMTQSNVLLDHCSFSGCRFDNSLLTEGGGNQCNIQITGYSDGAQITGCLFSKPTEPLTTGYAICSYGYFTAESGNVFSEFQTNYFFAAVDADNSQSAASRADRSIEISSTGGSETADTLGFGMVKITITGGEPPADAMTVTLPPAPCGWRFSLLIYNNGAGQVDVTLSGLVRADSASAIDEYAVNALSYELRTFQSVMLNDEIGWIYDSTPWGDVVAPT
jgi:hypothetical protein